MTPDSNRITQTTVYRALCCMSTNCFSSLNTVLHYATQTNIMKPLFLSCMSKYHPVHEILLSVRPATFNSAPTSPYTGPSSLVKNANSPKKRFFDALNVTVVLVVVRVVLSCNMWRRGPKSVVHVHVCRNMH